MWLREVNDVSEFAGRRRRAGFPFSQRVSGGDHQHGAGDGRQNGGTDGKANSALAHRTSEKIAVRLLFGEGAEARFDGRSELNGLSGEVEEKGGGPEIREAGPEHIGTFRY